MPMEFFIEPAGLYFLSLFSTSAMTGLIWLVQLAYYPSFRFAEESTFAEFANQHTYRTSLVVGPFMLLEVFSSVVLFWKISPASFYDIFNVVSLILIWASTLVLSIPCHSKLAAAKNDEVIRRLVVTNWPRTILWTVRSIFLLFVFYNLQDRIFI